MFVEKRNYLSTAMVVCVTAIGLFFCVSYCGASEGLFELNDPYWHIWLDAAGYADITYWHPSVRHGYGSHEMLSGEWGAAIYYDGIENEPNAMWLTDEFIYPNWYTDSNFTTDSFSFWNDANNPVWDDPNQPTGYNPAGKYDTAQSIISNGQVKIQIDYEMVDLGEQGPNGEGGSPMACTIFENGSTKSAFVRSERYILLQTYTITNIQQDANVASLEFYQMLHGHPADEYEPAVYSVYETLDYNDPLESYIHYNPVHTVGNFRYDITQWNEPYPVGSKYHQDWVGFSSTVEPNVIENGHYRGGHNYTPNNKPSTGTHWNIEERNLNGLTSNYDDEVAGAMGWYLPDLDPNESVSLTVAIMFGAEPIVSVPSLEFSKTDDVNECVVPDDYITYTITYGNPVTDPNEPNYMGEVNDVVITDYLSEAVDPNNPFDPNYNSNDHTYTWNIGVLGPGDSNYVTLTVKVNNLAEPLGTITNKAVLTSSVGWISTIVDTNVCCWNPGVIYVDKDATAGANTGMSWEHAYTDFQDALERARNCYANEIWVAEGTYKPTKASARSISFEMVDEVAIYGGFAGTESHPSQRDLTDPNNETILSGDIAAPNDHSDNSYHVVKCENVDNAILDGFTITAGNANAPGSADPNRCGGGIYSTYSLSSTITNCTFSDNSAFYGGALYDYNSSDVNITNCIFTGNTAKYYGGGIYNYQFSPALTNCVFNENHAVGYDTYYGSGGGIANYQSSPTLINCTFSGNSALFDSGNAGKGGAIYNTYGSSPTITYCIFSSNLSDANGGGLYNDSSDPNIANCIFSGNKANSDGGGVYNTSSIPKITNCVFTGNLADANGGGLYNNSSEPNITNCIFTGNVANHYGGGMYNCYESYAAVVNCIFSGNRADDYGGGIANSDDSNLTLTNCTVSENLAYYGGGICSWNYADTNLTNCIFWDNEAGIDYNEIFTADPNKTIISYSDIKDSNGSGPYWDENLGMDIGYNIDEDPCFFDVEDSNGSWTENASYDNSTFQSTLTDSGADWSVNQLAGKFVSPNTPQLLQFFIVSNEVNTIKVWSDVNSIAQEGDTYQIYDYHLSSDSACIDAGDPNFNPDPNMTDIDGERRVVDGDANGTEIVDMGADEYYWSPVDFNSDGIVNFFDYALFANFWQTTSDVYDLIDDNNYIDYNDLARFCEDWLWQRAWAKAFPFSYGRGMGKSMGMGMGESLGLTEELYPSATAKKPQPQLTEADIKELLRWLADLWLTEDELRKMMSEDEWLKFMESVIQALKSQMQN